MKKYCVYMHTCPNGKVYIGITGREPLKRWNNGYGYMGNKHFFSAILKYGWENIAHKVICEGLSKEEACAKESEYIKLYESNNPANGYNNTCGGEGLAGYNHTDETKSKMSKAASGRKLSEATKQKLSEAHKGHEISSEQRKKISYALKGKRKTADAVLHMSECKIGHAVSDETRRKIGEANKLRKVSDETREKMRIAKIGRKHTLETRKKISEAKRRRDNVAT